MALLLYNKILDSEKRLVSELTKIYGIGFKKSVFICQYLNFFKTKKVGELTPFEIEELEKFLNNNCNKKISKNLDLLKKNNIQYKVENRSYKGIRHKSKLPVRGQRTRPNAKTQRKFKRNTKIKK